MTPQQTRLLAETLKKLENCLPELGAAVYAKLFELSPESRPLFKGDMEEQNAKLAKVFAEFVRVKTRSQHFLPVTKSGGEAVIPGVGPLGSRHEQNYGVAAKHYAYMREALLHALKQMLGNGFNEEVAAAWGETFDMLADAMQKHAGGHPEAQAFARIFSGKSVAGGAAETSAEGYFGGEGEDGSHSGQGRR
jgi:nitric oxide dioxygenase